MQDPNAINPQLGDRDSLMPLLNDIERLRGDLTRAANWIYGHWPAALPAWYFTEPSRGVDERVRLAVHCHTPEELTVAAAAMHPAVVVDDGRTKRTSLRFGRVTLDAWYAPKVAR